MSGFREGFEVVCVSGPVDAKPCSKCTQPQVGSHYTVRGVVDAGWPEGQSLLLVEITNEPRKHVRPGNEVVICEHSFFALRFRPVRYENVAIFRAMCCSTKPLVEV